MRAVPSVQEHGLDSIGRSRPWFESELQRRGIELPHGSSLRDSLTELRALELKASLRMTERMPAQVAQQRYLRSTGADFLSKALHAGSLAGLVEFDDYWQHLKSSNPIVTGPELHLKVAQERALSWELVLASLAATFCHRVHKAEPDVICEWEGKRIAIAAKMLAANTQSAFVGHIKKGIKQIQAADVTGGCVVINLVDLFPHESTFQRLHRDRVTFESTLALTVVDWVDEFLVSHHPDWRRLFKGNSKLMTIALFVPTVLTIWRGRATPLPYYRLHLFSAAEREAEAFEFTRALQQAFEAVLDFGRTSSQTELGTVVSRGALSEGVRSEFSEGRGALRGQKKPPPSCSGWT